MRTRLIHTILSMATVFCAASIVSFGQTASGGTAAGRAAGMEAPLPLDPAVITGKLANGLTYYIRKNAKPEKRLELRLVVNAGSVLEDEDSRGIAHFCEHMAFNGTERFKKHELTDYLESIGMRFGPELNAYTGFDETVYMLQVPTDSAGVVDTAFRILDDWSRRVSYEDTEIDRERGVVVEEWRLGRGADSRIRDRQLPILLKDSRYAERLPIGKKDVIENAPHDLFRRFYRTWYRPDLMAVVVVGDCDPAAMEKLIRDNFGGSPASSAQTPRMDAPVPDHAETLFAIATDPEATQSSVSVYWKRPVRIERTVGQYRRSIVEALFNAALNRRLDELTRAADAPFLGAYSAIGDLVRTKEVYVLGAGVRDGGIERGLEAILTEGARVARFGFTPGEIAREKAELLRSMETAYKERDKTESARFAEEYADNFLSGEPIPGVEFEYRVFRDYLPGIAADEVNALARDLITDSNRVVMASAPEKAGVATPSEAILRAVFERVKAKTITAYADNVSDKPLVPSKPKPGKVTATRAVPELGVTEWTLSNGIRVILKPTDFKNDEVLFAAWSPGGSSLVPDSLVIAAETATTVVSESGYGSFGKVELEKKLAGKIASVSPWIDDLREGLSGSASPQDLDTMFQLIRLVFTAPRADSAAFLSVVERMKGAVENRAAQPETAFGDTLATTLTGYSLRARPWTPALIGEMNLGASYGIYKNRFADAGDFTFCFIGAFDIAKLKPLVETWLGSLPTKGRKENWRDTNIHPPDGIVKKTVRRGIEPKSQTRIVFTGPFEWNLRNRYVYESLMSALRIRLREVLREDMSGTYGVSVGGSLERFPKTEYTFSFGFGSAPDRAGELAGTVFSLIDSVKTAGFADTYLERVKETQLRQREVNLKNNSFWLGILRSYISNGDDPRDLLKYPDLVRSLTSNDLKAAARAYLNTGRYVEVVLMPEKE